MATGYKCNELFDNSAAEFSDAELRDVSGLAVSKTYPMALVTQKMRPFICETGQDKKSKR